MNKKIVTKPQQGGVVLIVALVFLVALTAVAAALMQNTTTDMKMSGASEIREEAIQAAVSAVDEVIFNQVGVGQNNIFERPLVNGFPEINQNTLLPGTQTKATAAVNVANLDNIKESHCPRSKESSSVGVINCSVFRIDINRAYGRNGTSNISVSSGISQEIVGNN